MAGDIKTIGMGVYGFGPDILPALIKMRPNPIMLTVVPGQAPVDFYNELRVRFPHASIGLRVWMGEAEQLAKLQGSPVESAEGFADIVLKTVAQLPGIDWVSCLNETPADPVVFLEYLDIFQDVFIQLVQEDAGFPVVAFNMGVGNPQVGAAIAPYNPAHNPLVTLKSARTARYIGTHSYGSYDPHDPSKSLSIDDPGTYPWYAGRCGFMHDDIVFAGHPAPMFMSTESGSNQPWRGQYTEQEYFRQVAWFQDQININHTKPGAPYIVGQCLFGLFGDGRFPGFDVIGAPNLIDLIAGYNAAHQ